MIASSFNQFRNSDNTGFCYVGPAATDRRLSRGYPRRGIDMHIDQPTMFAITAFVTVVSGLLLLFSWLQDRKVTTLAFWGTGFLVVAAGGVLALLRGPLPDFLSISVGNPLFIAGYGLMWCGARAFEGRRPLYFAAFAGAGVWILLCQIDAIAESTYVRIVFTTAVAAGYVLLTASEYWRARDKQLQSRWPAIVLLLAFAAMCLGRIALADVLASPAGTQPYDPNRIPLGAFAMLAINFCMAFLIVNMVKERAERAQRQNALVDPLTGVANRRAFFERGERLLSRVVAEGQPAAVLVLDLDLFKKINDTFGHQAGDRVLCAFCETAEDTLRPNDLFGRMGGEEFACLLPGASIENALAVAERIRANFEGSRVPGTQVSTSTVSIGVAMANDVGNDLEVLLAAADHALYQAKANGRNRVERARTVSPPLQPAMQPSPPQAAQQGLQTAAA
jgi:diguanylate cyclase (GGDEF)-like protein